MCEFRCGFLDNPPEPFWNFPIRFLQDFESRES